MSTRVEKTVTVDVPVSRAYDQWTQFEDFPQFMDGVTKVTQLSDDRLEWVAEIAGVRRQWKAQVLEQVPDQKIAWAATEGATNAGVVTFQDVGGDRCKITLELDYEPEGLVEKVGDALHIVGHRAAGDLERFKAFVESLGYATGAWRGAPQAPIRATKHAVAQPDSTVTGASATSSDKPRTLTSREVLEAEASEVPRAEQMGSDELRQI